MSIVARGGNDHGSARNRLAARLDTAESAPTECAAASTERLGGGIKAIKTSDEITRGSG